MAGQHHPKQQGTNGVASGPNSVPAVSSLPKKKNCCCAPDRRHYSARSHHGPHPRNWSAFRGAP
jgi:hypothetical protein